MDIDLTIRGLQEAQAANLRRIAQLQPGGAMGHLIRQVTAFTHAEAVKVTHVDSGALRASHRMKITEVRGQVYIDPGAVNPRGQKPVVYGPEEQARGGSHAFYTRARVAAEQYFRVVKPQVERELVK
jgi:hypothetical protein